MNTAMDVVDGADLTGKTCVITGATAGLGGESARALARHNAATQVWAEVSAELADVGGVYLADCRIRDNVAPHALDQAHAGAL
ncbi:hypothetical protein [Mycolicibacterium pulveris]|uniref:hypothetical protein n=1 Tax=Mycolicibacterium pulveris TaxID=36813 RepID=UPI003CEC2B4B